MIHDCKPLLRSNAPGKIIPFKNQSFRLGDIWPRFRWSTSTARAAVDRVEALAECVSRDGVMIYSKQGPKAHPALKEELAARAFICRTLQRLGINVEAIKPPGRPSGHAHWTATP